MGKRKQHVRGGVQYILEHTGVWHITWGDQESTVMSVGYCMRLVKPVRRVTKRPKGEDICCRCLWAEHERSHSQLSICVGP